MEDHIDDGVVLELIHDVLIQALYEFFHLASLVGKNLRCLFWLRLLEVLQHHIVEKNEWSIDKILDHFLVLFLLISHVLPAFEDVEGKWLSLLTDTTTFWLSEDVWDRHKGNRALFQRLRIIVDDQVKACKEAHVINSLYDFFDSRQIQDGNKNSQERYLSLCRLGLEAQDLHDWLHAAIRNELIVEELAVGNIGQQYGDLLGNEWIRMAEQVEHSCDALHFSLLHDEIFRRWIVLIKAAV